MNTTNEETREDGNQRRNSIGTPGSMIGGSGGGHGGGLTVSGGKTRRYSIGIPNSRKSIEEEGKIVPNYLRASTGSCHDFCKYGKKHEHSKSAIPVKFKRSTTVVNKEKVTITVKSKIKPFTDPKIETPVELTKKNISLPSKKPQVLKRVLSTNGKPKEKEVKIGQRSTSVVKTSPGLNDANGGVKKKDVRTVKKTGMTPKAVVESQSQKASSFSKGESLKVIKHKNVKHVSPLKDKNRVQKIEIKKTESETIELDYVQENVEIVDSPKFSSMELINDHVLRNGFEKDLMNSHSVYESSELFQEQELVENLEIVDSPKFSSMELINDYVLRNGFEKDSMNSHSVHESSKLFQEQELLEDSLMEGVLKKSESFSEVLEEDSLIAPPVSESSQSYYDDEALEDESEFTDDEVSEEESESNEKIPRKGRMVISDKDDEAVKLRFRRGKILDIQSENNGPRRLKFRKGKVLEGNEERQNVSRRSFEKKNEKEKIECDNVHESVVLKHQGEQGKKDAQGLFNNVIEETASKLVESRKSKVKALVGAFETVISLQDGKP